MRRREVAVIRGRGVVAWGVGAAAGSDAACWRDHGNGGTRPPREAERAAFERGLLELGFVNGRNVHIDYRFGASQPDSTQAAVAKILSIAPDAVMVHGTAITAVLQQQTRTVSARFDDPANAPRPRRRGD